jgi:hypothetical protein
MSESISENYVKALSPSVSSFLDDNQLKICSFQTTFFSHTAKLIPYWAVGCCAGAGSSHSPTTPAFLQILSCDFHKAWCRTSDSQADWVGHSFTITLTLHTKLTLY